MAISPTSIFLITLFYFGNHTPGRRALAVLIGMGVVLAIALWFWMQRIFLVHWKSISNRVKVGCILVSLFYGVILATFLPDGIPAYRLQRLKLVVTALSGSGSGSEFGEVTLLGFESDGQFISYGSMDVDGGWKRSGNSLTASSPYDRLQWQGRASSTVLIFEGSPGAGRVQIDWDGDIRTYDLQGAETKEVYIHDFHPVGFFDRFLIAFLLVSVLTVYCLFGVVCLLLAWKYPEDNKRDQGSNVKDGRWRVDLLIILSVAVVSVVYFLIITRSIGLLVSADSMDYIAAARHVLAGEGYIGMDTDTFTWWPPLYPLFLAGLEALTEPGTLFWYQLANILLMVISIFLAGFLLKRVFRRGEVFPAGALVILVFSIPFLFTFTHLLSEALFFPLYILFLGLLLDTVKTQDPISGVFLTFVGSLLVLCRYASVPLIFYSGLCLLVFLRNDILQRFIKTLTFAAMALLPTMLWVGRNQLMTGTLVGVRIAHFTPPLDILGQIFRIFIGWYQPRQGQWLVMCGLLFLIVLTISVNLSGIKQSKWQDWVPVEVLVLGGWVFFYVAYLVVSLSRVWIGGFFARYLYVIHAPVMIILALWFDRLGSIQKPTWRKVLFHLSALLTIALLLIAPFNARQDIVADQATRFSQGFSLSSLEKSEVLHYLLNHVLPDNALIFSNCHRCIYLFDHIFPVWSFSTEAGDQKLPNDQEFYLVWFDWILTDRPYQMAAGEMPDIASAVDRPVHMELVAHLNDGRIFRVIPR